MKYHGYVRNLLFQVSSKALWSILHKNIKNTYWKSSSLSSSPYIIGVFGGALNVFRFCKTFFSLSGVLLVLFKSSVEFELVEAIKDKSEY